MKRGRDCKWVRAETTKEGGKEKNNVEVSSQKAF